MHMAFPTCMESSADLDLPKSWTNVWEQQLPSRRHSVMDREDMAGETLIMEIILTLEEYIRENNGILHQQEEPKTGRSEQPGNQACVVNRNSYYS